MTDGWYMVEYHGLIRRPALWFFPLGIVDVKLNGAGLDVILGCGCILFYVARARRAMAPCWEHQSQWTFGQSIMPEHPAHRN